MISIIKIDDWRSKLKLMLNLKRLRKLLEFKNSTGKFNFDIIITPQKVKTR